MEKILERVTFQYTMNPQGLELVSPRDTRETATSNTSKDEIENIFSVQHL